MINLKFRTSSVHLTLWLLRGVAKTKRSATPSSPCLSGEKRKKAKRPSARSPSSLISALKKNQASSSNSAPKCGAFGVEKKKRIPLKS